MRLYRRVETSTILHKQAQFSISLENLSDGCNVLFPRMNPLLFNAFIVSRIRKGVRQMNCITLIPFI